MFLKLANTDINIASYSVLAEWAKTQNCDHKITYKFNDKSLARYKYKQKQTPLKPRRGLHLYALFSHQTLSVIAPIFLKSLSVKLPDGMSR